MILSLRPEALRTTLAVKAWQPMQLLHAPAPVVLPLVDLSDLPGRASRTEVLLGEPNQRLRTALTAAADAYQPGRSRAG